jgi:ectoine hydroxylase-related dioxygenase (phytanoyl-CoA dioxygenase family)
MASDLSLHHRPVTQLFPQPGTPAQWEALKLTEDQVSFYRERGYLPGVRILDDPQIEALRAELEIMFKPDHDGRELWYEYHSNESGDPGNVLFHALGAWRIGKALHDILWAPRFLMAAAQLLGGPVRFWHDQLFCKPARHGGVVAWHQDYSYWTRTQPMAHLTCWIGLDDSTIENGCVHYVPGSHTWTLLPITGLAGDMDGIRKVLSDEQWAQFQKPHAVELQRGESTFHHPLMVHGSYGNRTQRPRRAVVLNVVRDGVFSQSDAPLLQGVPPIAPGKPLSGQFFPLLFDPAALGVRI